MHSSRQQESELMEIGGESEDAQSLGGEGGKGQKGGFSY